MTATCDIPGIGRPDPSLPFPDPALDPPAPDAATEASAILAGGCFWCTEAVFRELEGVLSVTPGYSGGDARDANYERVCMGTTGHAEAIAVRYDPRRISYGQLLKVFFSVAHDPTQVNRQGNDLGTQYRSAIFVADEAQREVATAYIRQLEEAKVFEAPIATVVAPLEGFHEAEGYHHDYAARNPAQPYIAAVAAPKVEKLRSKFADRLKGRDGG